MHKRDVPWKFRRADLFLIIGLAVVGVALAVLLAGMPELASGQGSAASEELASDSSGTTGNEAAAGDSSNASQAASDSSQTEQNASSDAADHPDASQVAQTGYLVVVTADGASYGTWPLSGDTTIDITTAEGTNQLVIRDGTVWMEKASCKNQVCVETGRISRPGELIVCLPNRVVVEIRRSSAGNSGAGSDAGSDSSSGSFGGSGASTGSSSDSSGSSGAGTGSAESSPSSGDEDGFDAIAR